MVDKIKDKDKDSTEYGKVEEKGNGKLEVPDNIVRSVDVARTIYDKFRTNHLPRVLLYKEIEGLVQGNPPYDPKALREANLNIANFNDMSARAVIERACLAYWNLLYNAQYLVKFVVTLPTADAPKFADILARNWDYAVKTKWKSFNVNMSALMMQLVKFGIAPVLFPDERSPKWRLIELHRFYVADQAQADLDMMNMFFVETDYSIQYLWGIYKNLEDDSNSPWNKKELGHLLIEATRSAFNNQSGLDNTFDLERMRLTGDSIFDSLYHNTIKVISFFQREYDEKISHYMFHRQILSTEKKFLFEEPSQYKNVDEALILFTMNPGEYTLHSNRGLGHKIFSLAQAKIQTGCSIVDLVKWSSTPILKSSSLATKDVDQVRFMPGVPTNIGSLDFVPNNLGANVQAVVSGAEYLESQIQYNITYSGADPAQPDPDTGSVAPSQARLMAFREFAVLKNNINHFQKTCDLLFGDMTGKMLRASESDTGYEIAKCWKDRCLKEGVPPEVFEMTDVDKDGAGLPKHLEVYATRAAGAGSQVAELIALQELGAIAGSFGPREARAFRRRYVAATIGYEHLAEFDQDSDDADELTGGASLAGVENAIMRAGQSPIFSADNEHRAHATIHMTLGKYVIDSITQGQMTVIEADSIFAVSVPHLTEHMKVLEKDIFARDFYGKIKPLFDQVVKYATLNRKNATAAVQAQKEEQAKAAQNQEQVMNEEQLKTMQVLNEEKRKDLKLVAQSTRQEKAGAAKEAALDKKVTGELAIKSKAADIEGDIKLKKTLANNADSEASSNPGDYLDKLGGNTPSPSDLK